MLNIGGGEVLLILLIALIVLGPDKLPDAARQAGKVMKEFRKISSSFQREMKNAMKDPVAAATMERGWPDVKPMAAFPPVEDTGDAVPDDAVDEHAPDHDGAAETDPDADEPELSAEVPEEPPIDPLPDDDVGIPSDR